MPREFQKWLFEQIARKNPEEKSLVRELADVLTLSVLHSFLNQSQ